MAEEEKKVSYEALPSRSERLPGASAWAAFFCAAAALLTLFAYIRLQQTMRQSIHSMEVRNAVLESNLRQWAEHVKTIDMRLASLEELARWMPSGEQFISDLNAVHSMRELFPPEAPDDIDSLWSSGFPAPATPLPVPPGDNVIDGKRKTGEIIFLDLSINRIMINMGREDDLEVGQTVSIYRNGIWLGDVRTLILYDNIAACVFETVGKDFQIGDEVRRQ